MSPPRNRPLKRRLRGDNPVFRQLYVREHSLQSDLFERSAADRWLSVTYGPESDLYAGWLRSKGIDPETGRMSEEGLAFFKRCLEMDELRRRSTKPMDRPVNRVRRRHL